MPRPRKQPRLVRLRDRDNWYIRDGRETLSTGTPDEEEAQCFLAEYLTLKERPRAPTVAQLLDIRLEDLKARGVARQSNTAYYHNALKVHFGTRKPDQLTTPLVNQYLDKRKGTPASLREELLELRTTLRMAVRDGLIAKTPHIHVPPRRPPSEKFLTREQARALLDAAKPMHLRLYLLIGMRTGARKGAILGLTWDRVDLERARIDFTDPAMAITNKRRTVVPIGKDIIPALRVARQTAETNHVIEYMGSPIGDIKKAFAIAAKDAGVPWATPHTLKHSVISWLAEDKFSIDQISDLTATNPDTVRRIYRKFSPDYLEDMATSLDQTVSFTNQFAKRAR